MKNTGNVWKDLFEYASNEWDFDEEDNNTETSEEIKTFYEGYYTKKHINKIISTFKKYLKEKQKGKELI